MNELPVDTMSEDYQKKINELHQLVASDEKFNSFASGQPLKLIHESILESEDALAKE